jgi:hypothetical protein
MDGLEARLSHDFGQPPRPSIPWAWLRMVVPTLRHEGVIWRARYERERREEGELHSSAVNA